MPLQDSANDSLRVLTFADISCYPRTTLAQLTAGCLEEILTPTRDNDCGTAPGEFGGCRLAQIRTPAGDECDFAAEEVVGEDARGVRRYSPMTLITSRLDRWPSNSQ